MVRWPRSNAQHRTSCPLQVQDLKYATLATVSRCGMVWFSEDVLSVEMIFENYLSRLCNIPVEETEEDIAFIKKTDKKAEDEITPTLQVTDPLRRWNLSHRHIDEPNRQLSHVTHSRISRYLIYISNLP